MQVRRSPLWRRLPVAMAFAFVLSTGEGTQAQESTDAAQNPGAPSTEALAAAAQNPIAALISVPFQNNTYFGAGPNHDKTYDVLNIQPVLPFTVGDWNIISRTIAPLIYVPSVRTGLGTATLDEDTTSASAGPAGIPETFGLGDINQTFYFSPAAPSPFIWGVGPSIDLPTATERFIGSGKLSVGPAAVGLIMPRPWVIGLLARQLFSIAGPSSRTDVNQTLLQPFVNYNLPDGWYLSSSPVITANWSADSSQRWSVPIGGGVGKIFKIANQPINASFQAFDYVEHPSFAPRWALRFQVQFLFPR
jgi:hypothetical protein